MYYKRMPEKILFNIPDDCFAKSYRGYCIQKIIFHQYYIGTFDGHIRSCANSHSHISPGKGRCIIDTVTDHSYLFPLFLKLCDFSFFILRKNLRYNRIDLKLPADGFCGSFVIAVSMTTWMPSCLNCLTASCW